MSAGRYNFFLTWVIELHNRYLVPLILLQSFHCNARIVRFVFGKLTGKIKCDKDV